MEQPLFLSPARVGRLALAAVLVFVLPALSLSAQQGAAAGGRLLFAGDDDWDWATPLGADESSKLVRYGAMPWSALDWAEEGLGEVRGVFVGIPPDPKKTMTMDDLSELRGDKAAYRHHPQAPGAIAKLLEGDDPPNVIVLMQNTNKGGPLDKPSVERLVAFVKAGGRVVVLDEWNKHEPVLDAFVAAALALPAGPPIPEAPVPEGDDAEENPAPPTPEPKPDAEAPDPEREQLEAKFAELLPQLADESFKVREQASAAIRDLGPAVLNLFDDLDIDDPEVASRLAAIRRELRPQPEPGRPAKLTNEQRRAQRHARLEASGKLVTDAAAKLRGGKASCQLSTALVDADQYPLPVLRIAFP